MSKADPIVLHTMNFGGNLHSAARALNDLGLAEWVLTMQYDRARDTTVVVLRLPLSEKLDLQSRGKI